MDFDYRTYPVLVVDDEPDILRSFEINYGDEFNIMTADGGARGLAVLREYDAAVIVADQRMPAMSGAEFLEHSLALRPHAVRIILTGYTDHEALVRAVNTGSIYRYVSKPWESEDVRHTLQRAMEYFHLGRENQRLVGELRHANARLAVENEYLRETTGGGEIVGDGPAMSEVRALIAKVAPARSTVLIEGETGTGKELIARAIHAASPRRDKLFVTVNCAELVEGVQESELFGHRKGAFTGADAHRKGLFEIADGGTLFLDEITETKLPLQAKLLRVLQEGEIRPVGQNESRRVDVRIVAATNRRLDDEIKAGTFREDLYFRLNVFPIRVPPLRERREDIRPLIRHFVERISAQLNRRVADVSEEASAILEQYAFPGNVRELANEIERAILLAEPGASLTEDLLSDHLQEGALIPMGAGSLQGRTCEFERKEIEDALARSKGVKAHAADELGITYRGLLKKMRRLGMK